MNTVQSIMMEMIGLYKGDPKRIQHFIKVFQFAKLIGELEQVNVETQTVLEISALVHDIGIKMSEEKYQSSAGNYQELEGPPLARDMLTKLSFSEPLISRVCWLVGHHHTYGSVKDIDHRILVEADFLVNAYEDDMQKETIRTVADKIFRTGAGTRLLNSIYLDK